MPETRDIHVFRIAKTELDPEGARAWLEELGVSESYEVPAEVDGLTALIGLAAKRCYNSFEPGLNPNVTKVRDDWGAYFDNILSSGHGSVLEHATFSFAVENVSRVFTAEMNRHRAGWAISEASMRFIRFDESIPYWLPISIRGEDVIHDPLGSLLYNHVAERRVFDDRLLRAVQGVPEDERLVARKQLTREIMNDVFDYVEKSYAQLLAIWDMDAGDKDFGYKKQVTSCLRRIVPLGVCTGGVWTGNVRGLRHVMTMRCAPSAEEEIRHVFSMICANLSAQYPMLFGDFHRDEATGCWQPKYWKV